MVVDGVALDTEEFRHLFLTQSESFTFKQNLDPHGSIRRRVEDDFVIRWGLFAVWSAVHPNFPPVYPRLSAYC
jgi:hypothetical protein